MSESVLASLKTVGWVTVPDVVPPPLVGRLRADLAEAHSACRHVQTRNGLGDATDGTVHHIVTLGPSFLVLLDSFPLWPVLDAYFGGKYILNSFGGVVHVVGTRTYIGRVHRDVRTFTGRLPLMINMLVMLDPFTAENGATHLLSGSHLQPDKPTDDDFFLRSDRAVGSAGTVLLFDSNLWHAAGVNRTGDPRRALTLTFTPPYLKQQCDYPRLFGYEPSVPLTPWLRQLLGYNARIPTSLEEWYQPPEKRLYQRDQG